MSQGHPEGVTGDAAFGFIGTWMGPWQGGATQAAHWFILRVARTRFGPGSPDAVNAIKSLTSLERLSEIADRLLDATSWDDLLATP